MALPYDPATALGVLNQDPPLARLIDDVGPFRPDWDLSVQSTYSPFHALMRSIIYQQLSGKAAATIHGRVLDLFPGDEMPAPEDVLGLPDEDLRGVGVSRAKTAAIKDLAVKTIDGVVPPLDVLQRMEDDAIVDRLTAVRGVGRWTVEMLLIFYLGRPDVLPVTDLGIRKGFMVTYALDELPEPAELARYGSRWQPYRSVASWYLWRSLDL